MLGNLCFSPLDIAKTGRRRGNHGKFYFSNFNMSKWRSLSDDFSKLPDYFKTIRKENTKKKAVV